MKWVLRLLIAIKIILICGQWLIFCDGVDNGDYLHPNLNKSEDVSIFGTRDQPPPPRDPFPSNNVAYPNSGGVDRIGKVVAGQGGDGITFQPQILEYGSSPVCIPTVASFSISSTLDMDVELISISADDPQFYPVVFQSQTLGRRETVTIRILFLPFSAQAASATLTISTSIGVYQYSVVGAPAYNSYRLHPFVGYRVPSGVPFEQPITIYNPHKEVLHIREVFTTEEFISLRGATPLDVDGPGGGTAWQVDPGEERSIIHVSMGAAAPGFYAGYVHLKTDKDNIVIPVDIQVLEGGLHASPETVDFGVLTREGEFSRVELKLLNSGSRPLEVLEILPVTPDASLQIVTSPHHHVIPNGTEVVVASLLYTCPLSSGKVSGTLLVVTNHSNPALAMLEISYEASSLHGGIEYDFRHSLFTLSLRNMSIGGNRRSAALLAAEQKKSKNLMPYYGEPDDIRHVVLTNFYSAPLQILDVSSTTCPDVFFVAPVEPNLSMDSLEKSSAIQVQFNRVVAQEMFKHKGTLPKSCWLEVQTNLSTVRVPLLVMDGSLDVSSDTEVCSLYCPVPECDSLGVLHCICDNVCLSV